MKGAFTSDPFPSLCGCGERVHLSRRGPVTLIPSGHRCEYYERQAGVLRTVAAEEACGIRVTPREVAERLRSWGVGDSLRSCIGRRRGTPREEG